MVVDGRSLIEDVLQFFCPNLSREKWLLLAVFPIIVTVLIVCVKTASLFQLWI